MAFPNEGQDQEAEPAHLGWEKAEVSMRDLSDGQKGITIGFCDIEFRPNHKKPHILRGLSGEVPRSTLLGMMGPSGVGKCKFNQLFSSIETNHEKKQPWQTFYLENFARHLEPKH